MKDEASTNPMQVAGAIIILLSFIPLAFDIDYSWIITIVAATVGLLVLAQGYVISAHYNPNAGDPAPRKDSAQKNTVWGEKLVPVLEELRKGSADNPQPPGEMPPDGA